MVVLAIGFTAAVSAVHHLAADRIEANRLLEFQRDLLDVAGVEYSPAWPPQQVAQRFDERVERQLWGSGETQSVVYVVFDALHRPSCYVFAIGGRGFWGPIQGLIALEPDFQTIRGIVFTEQSETPGLGARIREDPWFAHQFRGKMLAPHGPPYLQIVVGQADGPHQVEAITGATQTSTTVNRFLNDDLARILQSIRQQHGGRVR